MWPIVRALLLAATRGWLLPKKTIRHTLRVYGCVLGAAQTLEQTMGRTGSHDSIIREAARVHLAPLGFKQKGRSRIWLRDHGWWIGIVEFQPSSWSKGSYLNVACMWLWHPQDHFAFHVGERLGRYAEFVDESTFRSEVDALAQLAAAASLKNEHKFESLNTALTYLQAQAVGSQNHWDHYNALMASLALGEINAAARHLQSLCMLDASHKWCANLQSQAADIMSAARDNMSATVEKQVALTRERLRLPSIQRFFPTPGAA